jgi:hypothetical protein
VQFTFPAANGDVSAGQVTVAWDGTDADGDELTYYLRYSQDGFRFAPLATGITETHWNVDLAELGRVVDGSAFFQVIATDGLNTTVANSPVLFGGGAIHAQGGNDPWFYIVTPDDGKSYVRGSTVILHSSSWDIEDNAIFGASIGWSSDLDGAIGTGRTLGVADLSVGTHVITVTATDSNLQTSTDTATVTITARGLPGEGPVVNYCTPGTSASGCQAVLSSVGTPSATASSGFTLTASPLEGDKDGLFFFGSNGQQANPWGSGTSFQCVTPPVKRGGLLVGIGTPGTCDGSTSQDLNALWCPACPKAAKNPGAGTVTQAQFWYRDPFNTSNQTTSLSDAVEFTVQP